MEKHSFLEEDEVRPWEMPWDLRRWVSPAVPGQGKNGLSLT